MQSLEGTVEHKCEQHSTHKYCFFLFHQDRFHIKALMSSPIYTTCNKQQLEKQTPTQESSLRIQLGHFLKIYSNALTVKQHKVNVFQRGAGGRHKMVGDGLEDKLGSRLLWEPIPVRKIQLVNSICRYQ